MQKNPKDRHLDVPSEANRDKHINFAALENNDQDPADMPSTGALANQRSNATTFNLLIDSVPYIINAAPFAFNGETRYYVSVNGGTEQVFTWDTELSALRAINTDAGILPPALEEAISEKLRTLAQ